MDDDGSWLGWRLWIRLNDEEMMWTNRDDEDVKEWCEWWRQEMYEGDDCDGKKMWHGNDVDNLTKRTKTKTCFWYIFYCSFWFFWILCFMIFFGFFMFYDFLGFSKLRCKRKQGNMYKESGFQTLKNAKHTKNPIMFWLGCTRVN